MNSQVILPGHKGTRAAGQRRRRSSRGQAIAEGAAMLPLIIGLAVLMMMFLIYVGTTLYYQIQLGFVANQVDRQY